MCSVPAAGCAVELEFVGEGVQAGGAGEANPPLASRQKALDVAGVAGGDGTNGSINCINSTLVL